jgi:hypothetical protein
MADFMVYSILHDGVEYIGLSGRPLEDRKEVMRKRPVYFLKGRPRLESMQIAPLCDRRVPLDKGLALEAAFTAEGWSKNPAGCRGGPYCLYRLGPALRSELEKLRDKLKGTRSLAAKCEAVQIVASELSRNAALNKHLREECYKCGTKYTCCACKHLRGKDAVLCVPPKRRSGTSVSGSSKRKKKYGKTRSADPNFRQEKWGPDVAAGIWENNSRRTRSHGVRKRPAAKL